MQCNEHNEHSVKEWNWQPSLLIIGVFIEYKQSLNSSMLHDQEIVAGCPRSRDERGVWPWEKGREQFSCRVIGTSDEIIYIQT